MCFKYAGFANKMQEICKKYAILQTVFVEYAKNMQKNMQKYALAGLYAKYACLYIEYIALMMINMHSPL